MNSTLSPTHSISHNPLSDFATRLTLQDAQPHPTATVPVKPPQSSRVDRMVDQIQRALIRRLDSVHFGRLNEAWNSFLPHVVLSGYFPPRATQVIQQYAFDPRILDLSNIKL